MFDPGVGQSQANENLARLHSLLGLIPLGRVSIEERAKGHFEVWKERAPLTDKEALILLERSRNRRDGDFKPHVRPGHRSRELTGGVMAVIFADLRCLL